MREIKFRGYNGNLKLKNGRWIIGSFVRNDPHGLIMPLEEMVYEEYPVRVETVGQFTGLLDKNGKEIFEGDITNNGIIRFGKCAEINGVGFYLESNFSKDVFGELFRFTTPFEVLGNIYENPELE